MPTLSSAVTRIKGAGALLVFPIKDKQSIPSLWSAFYPRSKMSWDWSEDSDGRVAELWHLRTRLSVSGKVVYSKWFRNRATFFSLELFTFRLSIVSSNAEQGLSSDALNVWQTLNDDSPLSSKEIKRLCDLEGRENSSRFERALKQLWQRFLIVGYGEVEEGGYPSLAIGSSKILFEDQWDKSKGISCSDRRQQMSKFFPPHSEIYSYYLKVESQTMVNKI